MSSAICLNFLEILCSVGKILTKYWQALWYVGLQNMKFLQSENFIFIRCILVRSNCLRDIPPGSVGSRQLKVCSVTLQATLSDEERSARFLPVQVRRLTYFTNRLWNRIKSSKLCYYCSLPLTLHPRFFISQSQNPLLVPLHQFGLIYLLYKFYFHPSLTWIWSRPIHFFKLMCLMKAGWL